MLDLFDLPGLDLEPDHPGERLWYVCPSELPGTELIIAHSARCWRVFHEKYAFCAVPFEANAGNRSDWVYRGRVYSTRVGGIALIEPGEIHYDTLNVGVGNYWVVEIDSSLVQTLSAELGLGLSPHFRLAHLESFGGLQALSNFYNSLGSRAGPLELQSGLAVCIRRLFEVAGENKPVEPDIRFHPALRRTRDYLHEHWAEPVRLEDLVAVTGLSCFHLIRSFTATYGLPPHAYQNSLRVAGARQQLRHGIPPALVEVGFFDQSHLSRHFKRTFGVTPAEYQSMILPQGNPKNVQEIHPGKWQRL